MQQSLDGKHVFLSKLTFHYPCKLLAKTHNHVPEDTEHQLTQLFLHNSFWVLFFVLFLTT